MNIGVPNIEDLQDLAELITGKVLDLEATGAGAEWDPNHCEEMIYETMYDWCRDILKITPMNRM
jgi:hypothetical protein